MLSVRLNDSFTPNGSFPIYGEPVLDSDGMQTRIGYDAAVCVEVYEPWIVETYNSTGRLPTSTRIVGKNNTMADVGYLSSVGRRKSRVGGVERSLNSSGKLAAFDVAHDNSVNQMIKVRVFR